ncbi:Peptide methionine sulfoxide reductase MsrA [Croceitalea dokdonensis DOKDO 023]|uniref:Peptide methionine sulfoxide reductase MsrA n=1 Tax=Croceitalea dokdonensis DOKDO 023 TaxID=1300341 RepID=A0A0P7ATG8_9FLAO|nr:peptide-methionine (S)-S-oxide reductase MsrA [Croceitalea dokdonensis]KPM31734.1 Peptide methionine sulfoxide reductase MsrA [Croceitalea dokdonensis DOKDO 023]
MKYAILAFSLLLGLSCQSKNNKKEVETAKADAPKLILSPAALQEYETAYFASGCFWCVEAIFESVKGVKEVISGYSGGTEKNPTYENVAYGRTSHAEAVEVYYDPKTISFQELVQVFFGSHDPTTLNRQGPDRGAQYRSIAFFKNDREEKVIRNYIKALEKEMVYDSPIVTQVVKFDTFWKAEDYHQDFERRNPNQGYIKAVSIPRLNRFKENFPTFLKEEGAH